MKKAYIILLISLSIKLTYGQDFYMEEYISNLKEDTIQLDSIFVKGLNFYSGKKDLLSHFGKPDSIVDPRYECGGFSDEWQGLIFIQYYYGTFNYIGTNDEFQIEIINLENDDLLEIRYKNHFFSNKTKITLFSNLFPKSYKNRFSNSENSQIERLSIMPSVLSDDRVFFTFKNGLLIEIEYWTPC